MEPLARVTRRDIAFLAHDGTILRGWFYATGDADRGPGIVMTHGISATKEMALHPYAEVFAAAGMTVLVYDHRGFGASDGDPRQLIDPWVQTRDTLVAIDWFCARPEIDSRRIGVWGSSYSAGQALVIGALDERVRAVVANVPFVGRPREVGKAGADAFARFTARVRSATVDASSLIGPKAVVTENGVELPALMSQPEAAEWFLREGRRPDSRWKNEVWFPAASRNLDFNPAIALSHLHAPALFIVATDDRQAPTADAKAASALAGDRGELVVIEGHHFTPYSGEALKQASSTARDFFKRWL
jgi:pimeloyl-ACP methyl ester carboxylesterase